MRAGRGRVCRRGESTIDGMLRRAASLTVLLCAAAFAATACHQAESRPALAPAATAEDFHHSDPKIVGATGRPQLLEFFGPT